MSRKTNNELAALPGFFYYPVDATGLVELTLAERRDILTNQGNYAVALTNMQDENQRIDLGCACDNGRIPTHRRPDAVIPAYGDVPIDLREIMRV